MIDWSIIDERPKDEADYQRLLGIKIWRLNNLYWIKDRDGQRVKFRMNPPQKYFHEHKHCRNIILKARQIGFTTYIQIDMLDDALFRKFLNCGVIAHNKDDAESFFKDKIKFAYDEMPDHIKSVIVAKSDSARELEFSNKSRIRVSTSFRSGTNQKLHVSEFGKLCAKYPEKAREVKTGAFAAVHVGNEIDVESTAEGRAGDFFNMCQTAQRNAALGLPLTDLDFKFFFFPWYDEKSYTLDPEDVVITSKTTQYMDGLEENKKISISLGQRAWYQKTSDIFLDDMKREYPSTPEEAFEQSVEGAYFKTQMAQIRTKKQICRVPIEPGIPIHTFWDLGRDTTSIWFFQQVGYEYRFVDYYQNCGEDIWFYIHILKERTDGGVPYLYGDCYLPHDGKNKAINAKESVADALYNNGFQVRLVPRILDKTDSIAHARQVLPKCVFDIERCDQGIAGLDNYRKEWNEKQGDWGKLPYHGPASHPSDAFMVFADGYFHEEEIDDYLESFDQIHYTANTTTGY